MTEPDHVCKKCGYNHNEPGSMEAAVRVIACAIPEYTFITRKGEVPKTKEEELKSLAKSV